MSQTAAPGKGKITDLGHTVAHRHTDQTLAALERGCSYLGHIIADLDFLQTLAIGKRPVADLCNPIRDLDIGQLIAVLERRFSDLIQIIANIHIDQIPAIRKSPVHNDAHTVGDGIIGRCFSRRIKNQRSLFLIEQHSILTAESRTLRSHNYFLQTDTFEKRGITYLRQSGRKRHLSQSLAAVKNSLAECCDSFGNRHAGQSCRFKKRERPKLRHSIFDRSLFHCLGDLDIS